jgi:WD40 repeat protein
MVIRSYIWRIKPSPFNNDYVATSSGDRTVKIWNSFNWTLIQTYSHKYDVFAIEWLDKDTLASAGYYDQTIQIWSISSGQTKRTINVPNQYVYSLKMLNNNIHLAAGLGSYDINIYNINDGNLVSSLKGHTAYVEDLVQISDEYWLVQVTIKQFVFGI